MNNTADGSTLRTLADYGRRCWQPRDFAPLALRSAAHQRSTMWASLAISVYLRAFDCFF